MKPFLFLLSLITVVAGLTITVMRRQNALMNLLRSSISHPILPEGAIP